jgi:hypothetical protein
MKKFLFIPAIVLTLIATAISQTANPALAGGLGNNYIAPSVTFGGGSSVFGIDSKFGISKNFSLRPFISFPSNGTEFGGSLTYDWDLPQAALPITPFIGVGIDLQTANETTTTNGFAQIGADFNVNSSLALLGSLAIPFNGGGNTSFTLGAGFRF